MLLIFSQRPKGHFRPYGGFEWKRIEVNFGEWRFLVARGGSVRQSEPSKFDAENTFIEKKRKKNKKSADWIYRFSNFFGFCFAREKLFFQIVFFGRFVKVDLRRENAKWHVGTFSKFPFGPESATKKRTKGPFFICYFNRREIIYFASVWSTLRQLANSTTGIIYQGDFRSFQDWWLIVLSGERIPFGFHFVSDSLW